jgi:hypothetical protein
MCANAKRLVELARELSSELPEFQKVRGPGEGNRATNAFMRRLRERAATEFGCDFSERQLCGSTAYAADFYFPNEATIIEVALGLLNPWSEFDKDVLKALMAQEHGFDVEQLFFISRPGAKKKCGQPGRSAIIEWAMSKHCLSIEIHELTGRARQRRRRAQ